MGEGKHKQTSRRALKMWESDSAERPEALLANDYVNHQNPDVEGGVSEKNLSAWQELVSTFHRAFSNSKIEILEQIEEGPFVATRWRMTATQTGPYLGHAATHKRATWTGVATDRYESGRIAETWVDWDKYRMFEELGLLESRPARGARVA